MNKIFQRFDDKVSFIFLLHFKRYSKLERKIILLDFSIWNEFDIFTENWLRNHRIISLHKSESCIFISTKEMSIEMIVVFKKIDKKQFDVIVLEFILDFYEVLLRMQYEFL